MQDIRGWLDRFDVVTSDKMTKTELLLLVHNVKVKHDLKKRYVFDDLIKSTSRRVLRLPPTIPSLTQLNLFGRTLRSTSASTSAETMTGVKR